jgi:parallel beta-helix repeat protein
MRRVLAVCMLASAMMAGVLVASPPAGGVAGFGDVDADRFFTEPVQWMVDNDITTGTSPTCFSPGDPVTRGQAAAFMWRMEGFPAPGAAHPFGDVLAPWQQDPVSWMFNNMITTGSTPTTYSPDENLTRGQLAALLHRLEGSPPAPPPAQFADVVKAWQITPVGWLLANNITTGTSPTTFSPEDTVTRGQLAAFFYRYKDSPPVVVDQNHPAIPACAAQVAGPATSGDLAIDEDTTLIQNHDGRIVIAADNVTLNCAGHTITGPGRLAGLPGINLVGRTGVTVRNCVVQDFNDAFRIEQSDGNTFTDNTVSTVRQGFTLLGSDNNTLTGNRVTDANDWFGYGVLDGSTANELRDNTATSVAGVGFIIWASNDNVITGNEASDNFGNGFGANAGAAGNTFSGNTANNNTLRGIEDQTSGATGNAGTDNHYSSNVCAGNLNGGSDPPGLC